MIFTTIAHMYSFFHPLNDPKESPSPCIYHRNNHQRSTRCSESIEHQIMPAYRGADAFLASLNNVRCALCSTPFDFDHRPVMIERCRHVFGQICLEQWVDEGRNRCPTCQAALYGDSDDGHSSDHHGRTRHSSSGHRSSGRRHGQSRGHRGDLRGVITELATVLILAVSNRLVNNSDSSRPSRLDGNSHSRSEHRH